MSLFATMLEKLGLRKKDATAAPQRQSQAAPRSQSQAAPTQQPTSRQPPQAAPQPAPMAETDVVAKLESMAESNPQKLNWRTSIVDLMKLLGMDSGLQERKALAIELGCPPELMQDSAQMNIWLHKQVLRRIAQNGGNVPAELYD